MDELEVGGWGSDMPGKEALASNGARPGPERVADCARVVGSRASGELDSERAGYERDEGVRDTAKGFMMMMMMMATRDVVQSGAVGYNTRRQRSETGCLHTSRGRWSWFSPLILFVTLHCKSWVLLGNLLGVSALDNTARLFFPFHRAVPPCFSIASPYQNHLHADMNARLTEDP